MPWHIELDWGVAIGGYELKEYKKQLGGGAVLSGFNPGWHLLAGSKHMKNYQLRDLESRQRGRLAFAEFANIALPAGGLDPKRLVEFARNYGLPSESPTGEVGLDLVARRVKHMRSALGAIWLREGDGVKLGWAGTAPEARIEFVKTARGSENRIVLRANTLHGFLWTQMLMAIQQGIQIKRCVVCANFMAAKADKRETCSETCRQRLQRLNERKQATDRPHEEVPDEK